jgi:cytochrome P450
VSVAAAVDSAEFAVDPYPTYRNWQQAGAVHWSEEFFGGAWLVTRHADVESVLRDSLQFSARRTGAWGKQGQLNKGARKEFQRLFSRSMLFLDEPDHSRVRCVLNAGFRRDAIDRLVPAIERRVDHLLDAVDAREGFDFMQAIARPLPSFVMSTLLGVPSSRSEDFAAWTDAIADFIGAPSPTEGQVLAAQDGLASMGAFFEEIVSQRRSRPASDCECDDLIGRLLRAEGSGAIAPGSELISQCAMLLFAGLETTRNLLGNALHLLIRHPHQALRLQREPALLANALREILRFESPVQYTGRRATTDLVMHGKQIRRGDLVIAFIGAAGRDEARHEAPNVFDIARPRCGSLPFGSGPHVCIGAGLTLVEADIVFRRLLARFPNLGPVESEVRWNGNKVYRGLETLLVRDAGSVDE